MLTMAIPDVEILEVRLFALWFSFIHQMAPMFVVQEVVSLREYGRCTALKVVKSCSCGHFLLTLKTLLLQDVSVSHNAQRHRQTDRRTHGQADRQTVNKTTLSCQYSRSYCRAL